MDWLLKPFGLTQDQQAEQYSTQLKDDRSGTKDWNAGDMLRDVFTPGTREELEAKAKKFKEDKINKLTSGRQGNITESLGNTQIDTSNLTIGDNETETKYETRLKGLEARGAANLNNLQIKGYDPSKITDDMSTSEIYRLGTTQKTTNEDAEETKVRTELLRQEDKADTRYYRDKEERRAEQRFQSRRDDNRNDLTLQLAQMDSALADKRLAYDRETRSMDKRDRAIATLMSSLGSLGGAFAL